MHHSECATNEQGCGNVPATPLTPQPCLFVCQASLSIGALFTTTLCRTGSNIILSQMTMKSLLKPLKRNGSHALHSPLTPSLLGKGVNESNEDRVKAAASLINFKSVKWCQPSDCQWITQRNKKKVKKNRAAEVCFELSVVWQGTLFKGLCPCMCTEIEMCREGVWAES